MIDFGATLVSSAEKYNGLTFQRSTKILKILGLIRKAVI